MTMSIDKLKKVLDESPMSWADAERAALELSRLGLDPAADAMWALSDYFRQSRNDDEFSE
jgi:hypothetical protein